HATPASGLAPQPGAARVSRRLAELGLDLEQAVVLGDALRPGGRTGLDHPGARRHYQVRDGRVLGLTGAVRDDRAVARLARHVDRLQGLGQGADLVDLDQDRAGNAALDALLQARYVRHEQVVADELHLAAHGIGQPLPALPIVLRHSVLDGDDRIAAGPFLIELRERVGVEGPPFAFQVVLAVFVEL